MLLQLVTAFHHLLITILSMQITWKNLHGLVSVPGSVYCLPTKIFLETENSKEYRILYWFLNPVRALFILFKMSEERKKVSAEQLKILIEELEKDRTLVSGRDGRAKPDHLAKWEQLARRLNSTDSGALKSVTKWQQSLRDWKNNTKKKATKLGVNRNPQGDSNQELTSLELRLLALYSNEAPPAKTVGIDISSIAEVDPLSSDNSCDDAYPYPSTFTSYSCDATNENSSGPAEETGDDKFKVKRRRIQVISEDVIRQQNSLLERLMSLEAARQESENRQNKLLDAVAGALERHAAATSRLARAADAHAHAVGQVLGALRDCARAADACT